MRADELMAKDDLDGQAVWKLILKAIDELLANERPEDAGLHRTRLGRSQATNPVVQRPLLSGRRAFVVGGCTSAFDAVDGSHPTASRCAKSVVFINHGEIGAVHERSYHDRS